MASITRRPQHDRAERAAAMRARTLEAIERLLEEGHTFSELSVERIVGEVGISRSTFYVYFEDKGHLLRALTGDLLNLMLAAGRAWWSHLPEGDYDELETGIRELLGTYRQHSTLMAAIVDTSGYDPGVRAELHDLIVGGQKEMASQLEIGKRSGRVRARVDPIRTAGWLSWMVERGMHELVREADEVEVDQLAAALSQILWDVLYEEEPSK